MFCPQTKLASFYLESPSGSEIEPRSWLNYVGHLPLALRNAASALTEKKD